MNYYIQGDPSRAEEIKAAFERKGIHNNCNCKNENYLYYSCDGTVNFCFIGGGLAHIIKTHPDYQELELPVEPKFKVGDWIASIDDEGDAAVERIVNLLGNKVLLVDADGCFTEYPKGELKSYHLWTLADAKDGDILATDNGWTCIFQAFDGCVFSSYCFMDSQRWFCESGSEAHTLDSRINGNIHPATKEQRDLFFAKMKEAGYQWDTGKKELKKIQPHYDIANFRSGMPVLVRDSIYTKWLYTLFGMYNETNAVFPFVVVDMHGYAQCIPFEGNEHLLGTTDIPSEEYINW